MEKSKELEERVSELEKQNDEVCFDVFPWPCDVDVFTVKQKSQNIGE